MSRSAAALSAILQKERRDIQEIVKRFTRAARAGSRAPPYAVTTTTADSTRNVEPSLV
jgi:hypothetical protein